MSRSGLNAARRPFQNTRPIRRTIYALWIGGVVLLLLNGLLYWRAWTGQNDRQNELVRVEREIVELTEREKSLKAAFAGLEVDLLNERVGYLNGKLAERTFGWSQLFERLSEVLPNDVRLHSLSPRFTFAEDDILDVVFTGERVNLQLIGSARNDEALLEFIDALFKHHSFKYPSIATESKTERGETNWVLSAVYLPLAEAPEQAATEEGEEPESEQRDAAEAEGDLTESAAVEGEPDGVRSREEAS